MAGSYFKRNSESSPSDNAEVVTSNEDKSSGENSSGGEKVLSSASSDEAAPEMTKEQLQEDQESIKKELDSLSQKYRYEKQRLLNKEIEMTEQGTQALLVSYYF